MFKKMDDKEIVLDKIKKNVFQKISVTDRKSHIWQHFYEIRDYENTFQNYLLCKGCDSLFVYKCGRTGTSSLGRHTTICQKQTDSRTFFSHKKQKQSKRGVHKVPTAKEATKSLLSSCMSFVIKDIRPFEMFEGEGMMEFSQALIDIGAKYGKICSKDILPHASVVAQCAKERATNVLPNVLEEIKSLLRCGQHVAISTDSWSDNNRRTYLSISCHFITDDWELKKVTLGCTEMMYKKAYIDNEILEFLNSLDFETVDIESKFTFVSNRSIAIDMESREANRQPCVIHIINTILFHTFCETTDQPTDEVGDIYFELHDQDFSDNMQELFSSCIDFMAYIKSLDPNLITNVEIKSSWNTKYALIMNLSKEESNISECLQALNEDHHLQSIDFTIINIISAFLEPFKIIIDALQDESTCTIYGVLLFKMKLDNHIQVKFNDPPILRKLKKRAEIILKEKFTILLHHKIATFLCPKFKSLQFLSGSEKEETYRIIQQKVSELYSLNGTTNKIKPESKSASSNLNRNKRSLLDFEEFSDQVCSNEQDDDSSGNTQFFNYLQSNIECEINTKHIGGVDLLKFWKNKEKSFPVLAKLAKSTLCIPAYSVDSEKIFESSNWQQEERRSNMSAENLSALLILNTADETKS